MEKELDFSALLRAQLCDAISHLSTALLPVVKEFASCPVASAVLHPPHVWSESQGLKDALATDAPLLQLSESVKVCPGAVGPLTSWTDLDKPDGLCVPRIALMNYRTFGSREIADLISTPSGTSDFGGFVFPYRRDRDLPAFSMSERLVKGTDSLNVAGLNARTTHLRMLANLEQASPRYWAEQSRLLHALIVGPDSIEAGCLPCTLYLVLDFERIQRPKSRKLVEVADGIRLPQSTAAGEKAD